MGSNPIICCSVTHWASTAHGMKRPQPKKALGGPTGGNVRPAAISPNTLLDNMLAAQCAVDDLSTEFPKITSTGNIPPDLCHKSASSGPLCRQSASAEM